MLSMFFLTNQKRVATAREYLNKICGGNAMPALALANDTTDGWIPVGEEMLMQSRRIIFVLTVQADIL